MVMTKEKLQVLVDNLKKKERNDKAKNKKAAYGRSQIGQLQKKAKAKQKLIRLKQKQQQIINVRIGSDQQRSTQSHFPTIMQQQPPHDSGVLRDLSNDVKHIQAIIHHQSQSNMRLNTSQPQIFSETPRNNNDGESVLNNTPNNKSPVIKEEEKGAPRSSAYDLRKIATKSKTTAPARNRNNY